jgi:hypothetical protein
MPQDLSFGVLVFNFGNYGSSEAGARPQGWVDDAMAAVGKAAQLEGADPARISTIGASIGADGSVDGCYTYNMAGEEGTCLGALSLSPGNYLTNEFTYAEAVEYLDDNGYPVWCLAAENDGPSPGVCASAAGERYQSFIYSGNDHGMFLIQPNMTPTTPSVGVNTMIIIQDFLEEVYGVVIN